MNTIRQEQREAYRIAVDHGFMTEDHGVHTVIMHLGLIMSEAAEAIEEIRKNADPTHHYYREDGKPEGFGAELADIVIHTLMLAEHHGLDMASLIPEKSRFNATRPFMHNKTA